MNGAYYFIIGGGALQVEFIRKVNQRGFRTVVFDYNPQCEGAKLAYRFVPISIDDVQGVLALAQELKPVAVQTVATEMGNITACAVGERLGLYNNTLQTALDTTDKSRMKEVCRRQDIPTAHATAYTAYEQTQDVSFPCVVKASDRSASRGVTFAKDRAEFDVAWQDALGESKNKIVLVEEFLQGDQYSVETISVDGRHQIVGVTAEHTTGIPYFIECLHTMPAPLDISAHEKLDVLVSKILDTFGVRYGAGHIELKYHNQEWRMIELASRMGGWRDNMAYLSRGVDYLDLIIESSLNHYVPIQSAWSKIALIRILYNDTDVDLYNRACEQFGDQICGAHIEHKKPLDHPTTLMDSIGWYFFVGDNQQQVDQFLNWCNE